MQPSENSTVLSVIDYATLVHLGCTADERKTAQKVNFSVDVFLNPQQTAEESDSLTDTVCYAQICEKIEELVKEKEFNLVESLARATIEVIKEQFGLSMLRVLVHKVSPPVAGLSGGVKYACSSWS
ncbi:MAG: dihydroneopterin aldolase [Pseudomonadota bacterium]